MKNPMKRLALGALVYCLLAVFPAFGSCPFLDLGSTRFLTGDCTVDATFLVPDGMVLDGGGYTVNVTDPVPGHFLGAVIKNAGSWMGVTNLKINAIGLNNVCDSGDNRLRGVFLQSASGGSLLTLRSSR